MKPIIFFSHSSDDRKEISLIKEKILKETGNTVEIFLSSDGASIPFGKNWLNEIEDALKNCRLMFSWITPQSLNSDWIYFESGYAYSRNINVVPVGFNGINLEDIEPPLNFLQGFNIKSSAGLNNLIAVINKEFELTFDNFFDDQFYENVINSTIAGNSTEILKYVEEIECSFFARIKLNDDETIEIKENWLDIIQNVLKDLDYSFTINHKDEISGVGFKIKPSEVNTLKFPEVLIDPLAVNNLWNLLVEIHDRLYDKPHERIALSAKINKLYALPKDNYFIGARLLNSEVDFDTVSPNYIYKFRNILFRISPNKTKESLFGSKNAVVFIINKDNEEPIPILPLIQLLLERDILTE